MIGELLMSRFDGTLWITIFESKFVLFEKKLIIVTVICKLIKIGFLLLGESELFVHW